MIKLEKMFDGRNDFEIKKKIYEYNSIEDIDLNDVKHLFVELIRWYDFYKIIF